MDIIHWIEAIRTFIFSASVLQVRHDSSLSLAHNIISWVKLLTTWFFEQTMYSLWIAGKRTRIMSLREMARVMNDKSIRSSHHPFRTYYVILVSNVMTKLQQFVLAPLLFAFQLNPYRNRTPPKQSNPLC